MKLEQILVNGGHWTRPWTPVKKREWLGNPGPHNNSTTIFKVVFMCKVDGYAPKQAEVIDLYLIILF